MAEYVEANRLSVREIPRMLAKEMIVANHYSKQWTKCSVALGLYYTTDNEHAFFEGNEEKLIGTICYGDPIGRHSGASIAASIERKSVYELVRLFVHDGYGSNAESFLIGESFRWLKKYRPKIKALISYSDPMRGHVGTVYQATNWLYQGDNLRWTESWLYKFEEDGKWQHGRTIFPYYGTNDIEKMKDLVEKDFWIKREMRKHRYVYLLGNKSEKRMAMKTMKHPLLPYPKERNITESEVVQVKVRSK